jgi:hypothetical protein
MLFKPDDWIAHQHRTNKAPDAVVHDWCNQAAITAARTLALWLRGRGQKGKDDTLAAATVAAALAGVMVLVTVIARIDAGTGLLIHRLGGGTRDGLATLG